jgi:replicative DNA helicase
MDDPALRQPPQNLEAERQLLSALMMPEGREAMHFVAPLLRPEDLALGTHQDVYRAMVELYEAGHPFDALAILDWLGRQDLRRHPWGDPRAADDALAALAGAAPHAGNAAYHARIVREKAKVRELIVACGLSIEDAYGAADEADVLVGRALSRIQSIDAGLGGNDPVPAADLMEEVRSAVEARRQGEVAGVMTGFRDVDLVLKGGFPKGGLIVIAGRPSMGKSAFALAVADRACVRLRVPTLFVSLEMGRIELGERLIAARAPLPGDRLQEAWTLRPEEWDRFGRAAREIGAAPLLVDDTPGASAQRIAALARREARRGLGMVVVDYLQLVEGSGDGDRGLSRQEIVAKLSRRMKTLARELAIPVVVLSQLNRAVEAREEKRPRMADLRESGAIENDADIVLLLHRPEYYNPNDSPGVAEAIIAKHRNGATGRVLLEFVKARAEFRDRVAEGEFIPEEAF